MFRNTGFGKPPLESRPKTAARLDLEVSEGQVSPTSCGLWGGDALLLSAGCLPATETETLTPLSGETHRV
jgi:hypothetical protein